MDRIWQWAWDRHGAEVLLGALRCDSLLVTLPIYLRLAVSHRCIEESGHYVEAVAIVVVAVPVLVFVVVLPGLGPIRLVEQWAAATRSIERKHWTPLTPGPGGRSSER